MTRVMLVPNDLYDSALEDAQRVEEWLDERGIDVVRPPSYDFDEGGYLDDLDLVVSLGGDGTLLRAAHLVGGREIPILGLSYGHLGFLTVNQQDRDVCEMVEAALSQEFRPSRRATIQITTYGIDTEGVEAERSCSALNEVVLARGPSGKMVEFEVHANGVLIDRLFGDGFVVASATGSTGYALSAGGPIVTPDFRGMVCVPIAPHTLTASAFLTSPSDVIELTVSNERSTDCCVFADGEVLASDVAPISVRVTHGEHDVILLTDGSEAFFDSVSRVFYGKVHGGYDDR